MRTKILLSVALALGIASLVLLILNAADQTTVTTLLVIGLVCLSIEYFASKKTNSDNEQAE